MDDYVRNQIDPMIPKYGYAVQVVADPENERHAFAYTVGLAAASFPELLIIGPLAPASFILIVNNAVKKLKGAPTASAGDYDEVIEGYKVRLRDVSVDAFVEYGLVTATWARARKLTIKRAMQIVLPDTQGRFPDEPGYDWAAITLLALPAPPAPER